MWIYERRSGDLRMWIYERRSTKVYVLLNSAVYESPWALLRRFWMVGAIFAAAVAWVVLGDDFGGVRITAGGTWRHYALIAALPVLAALLMTILFVPESPRYLAKTGVWYCCCRFASKGVVPCAVGDHGTLELAALSL